jgi:ubiquinone biosynthesis protein
VDDSEPLAKAGLRAAIKQILDDGFFHADPHPGNLLLATDARLCLLDWGMVGILTENDRYELVDLINAVISKDSDRLVDVLLQITKAVGLVERRGLERELMTILISYHARPLKDWQLGRLLLDVMALLREYELKMPSDLVLMIKALVTAEGTARRIYPELNVISESETYVKKLASERYKPDKIQRSVRSSLSQFFSMQQTLPRRILQIVEKVDRGSLNVRTEHHNLEGLRDTLENVSNRLTIGIITAAMIIASSMIITTGIGPHWFGFSALGIIGYLSSAFFGVWIIINIFRSRRY